jgi:hypothetical protein
VLAVQVIKLTCSMIYSRRTMSLWDFYSSTKLRPGIEVEVVIFAPGESPTSTAAAPAPYAPAIRVGRSRSMTSSRSSAPRLRWPYPPRGCASSTARMMLLQGSLVPGGATHEP